MKDYVLGLICFVLFCLAMGAGVGACRGASDRMQRWIGGH